MSVLTKKFRTCRGTTRFSRSGLFPVVSCAEFEPPLRLNETIRWSERSNVTVTENYKARSWAMGNLPLLDEVVHHKSAFFKTASAKYEDAKPGTLRLIPNAGLEAKLRRDYTGMQEMIIGDAPSFDEVIGRIASLDKK